MGHVAPLPRFLFIAIDVSRGRNYNVATMKARIITIGNSRGIRFPKPVIEESGLTDEVEISVKKGEIKIVPSRTADNPTPDAALLSEKALGTDWNRPEEDAAWANL